MQYFTIIALLAASFGGVRAEIMKDPGCNSPNFNNVDAPWPVEQFSERAGSVSTAQQVCKDIQPQFKSHEQKWDCRMRGDEPMKTSIMKIGEVNSELDGKLNVEWCMGIMERIVDDCKLGGFWNISDWSFSTQMSQTECGK